MSNKRDKFNKNKRLLYPWVTVFVAIIIANVTFGLYIKDIEDPTTRQQKTDTSIYDVELVKPDISSGNDESIVGVTRTEIGESSGNRNTKNLLNSEYYSQLGNDEKYNSLFEDVYHNHLRQFLNEKIGINLVASAEQQSLDEAGYDLSTARSLRIAAQVRTLENLYYSTLIVDRSIQKENGVNKFTDEMEAFIDEYYDLFRPVKVQTVFVPFKTPLYYVPYNYTDDSTNRKEIYALTNSFTKDDLFSTVSKTRLHNLLSALGGVDQYATTKSVTDIESVFSKLYEDYSVIIDSVLSAEIDPEVIRVESIQNGSGYLNLSSQTFDQRLKSYSGSYVPSQTNQSLVNTYLALDTLSSNNNVLSLGDQACDDLANSKKFTQIINPTIGAGNTEDTNIDNFLNSISQTITFDEIEKRRFSSCFSVLPIKMGEDDHQVIINATNYGIHFTFAKGNNERMANKGTFKDLFKKNLLADLEKCISDDIEIALKCEGARTSILPSFNKTKYLPLITTDIFDSINVYDSTSRVIFEKYQENIRGSFNNYGFKVWDQLSSFMSFELGASAGIPIELDAGSFEDNVRWQ